VNQQCVWPALDLLRPVFEFHVRRGMLPCPPSSTDICLNEAEVAVTVRVPGATIPGVALCMKHARAVSAERVSELDLHMAVEAWHAMEEHTGRFTGDGCARCMQATVAVEDALLRDGYDELPGLQTQFCLAGLKLLTQLGERGQHYVKGGGLKRPRLEAREEEQ
jgi:hypothetical protein